MDSIKQTADNVDKAIELALEKLDIDRDQAEINIVEKGSRGILGFIGAKKAVVEVKPKVNPVKIGRNFLESVFSSMPVDVELEIIEEKTNNDQVLYNIKSPDLGIIIGHRGETLDALQYLTSLVVNKNTNRYFRVLLDAEGYRDRRKSTLERLAIRLANKAVSKGRKVMLEPMPPHERRIIHITLREDERVYTYSEGKEPFRKVMIVAGEEPEKK